MPVEEVTYSPVVLVDMDKDRSNLKQYKYSHKFQLIPSKDMTIDEEMIKRVIIREVMIEKDFKLGYHPIFKLSIFAPKSFYDILNNNKKLLEIKFELISIEKTFKNPELNSSNKNITTLFEDNFSLMLPMEGSKPPDLLHPDVMLEFDVYLFSTTLLKMSKKIINRITDKIYPVSLIGSVITDLKYYKPKVLFGVPDNEEKLRNVIIPPMKFKVVLPYIQQHFGIYKSGLTFFSDFDRFYILPGDITSKPCYDHENKELPNVFINLRKIDEPDSHTGGMLKDEKTYIFNTHDSIGYVNIGHENSEIIGSISYNSPRIIDSNRPGRDLNFPKTRSLSTSGSELTGISSEIKYDPNSNPYDMLSKAQKIEENSTQLAIEFTLVDMSVFTPNKIYTIFFENEELCQKYSGTYKLVKMKFNASLVSNYEEYDGKVIGLFSLIKKSESIKKQEDEMLKIIQAERRTGVIEKTVRSSMANVIKNIENDLRKKAVEEANGKRRQMEKESEGVMSSIIDMTLGGGGIGSALSSIATGVSSVTSAISAVKGAVGTITAKIKSVVTGKLNEIKTSITNKIGSLKSKLKSTIKSILKGITNIEFIKKITGKLNDLHKFLDKTIKSVNNSIKKVQSAIDGIMKSVSTVTGALSSIVSFASNFSLDNLGTSLLEQTGLSDVVDTVMGIANEVLDIGNMIPGVTMPQLPTLSEMIDSNTQTNSTGITIPTDVSQIVKDNRIQLDFKEIMSLGEYPDMKELIQAIEFPVEKTSKELVENSITNSNTLNNTITDNLGNIISSIPTTLTIPTIPDLNTLITTNITDKLGGTTLDTIMGVMNSGDIGSELADKLDLDLGPITSIFESVMPGMSGIFTGVDDVVSSYNDEPPNSGSGDISGGGTEVSVSSDEDGSDAGWGMVRHVTPTGIVMMSKSSHDDIHNNPKPAEESIDNYIQAFTYEKVTDPNIIERLNRDATPGTVKMTNNGSWYTREQGFWELEKVDYIPYNGMYNSQFIITDKGKKKRVVGMSIRGKVYV